MTAFSSGSARGARRVGPALRFLCRLAKDLGHLDARRYEHAARALDETGRLVGGWRKADEAAQG